MVFRPGQRVLQGGNLPVKRRDIRDQPRLAYRVVISLLLVEPFIALAGQTAIHEVSAIVPVDIILSALQLQNVNDGDRIRLEFGPMTPVGKVGGPVALGSKEIQADSQLVNLINIAKVFVGMFLRLKSGESESDLGPIVEISGATLKVRDASSLQFPAGSSVFATRVLTFNAFGGPDWIELSKGESEICVGASKIGSSMVPRGTVIKFLYENNGPVDVIVRPRFEVLY